MCGIAGYIGEKKLTSRQLQDCHESMRTRGPDAFGSVIYKLKKKNVYLLHNRLKIIDLSNSANQPFSDQGYTLVFNGEIYNFKEIKKNLISKGYKFKTNSDTEVLLKNFIDKKFDAFNEFEGMWSIAIWDDNQKELILSRDRFGQKPLFYFQHNNEFYFGSQINQITSICNHLFPINNKKIFDYLLSGYRVVFKDDQTFYKKIKHFPASHYALIKNDKVIFKKYWSLNNQINNKISYEDAKHHTSELIKHSIKNCLISDQKISSMLSGGIDSNVIFSCIKDLGHSDITLCSIIDSDSRYNESKNIKLSLNKSKFKTLEVNSQDFLKINIFEDLKKKINFYSAPYLTISSYISSNLQKRISEKGIRVNLSGLGSDEIFTGYYQHHTYYLKYLKDKGENESYNLNYSYWRDKVYPYIRNPYLNDKKFFLKNQSFIYSLLNYTVNQDLKKNIKKKYSYNFQDKKYSKNFLKNRMYNEIFYENIPAMLFEDDRNHMYYSIENRSPYLDKNLVEFAMSLPSNYLIRNGMAKSILRDAFSGRINNKILYDSPKKGFNFDISKIFKLKKNNEFIIELLSQKENKMYEFINFNNIKNMLEKKNMFNSENKFLFSLINLFLLFNK